MRLLGGLSLLSGRLGLLLSRGLALLLRGVLGRSLLLCHPLGFAFGCPLGLLGLSLGSILRLLSSLRRLGLLRGLLLRRLLGSGLCLLLGRRLLGTLGFAVRGPLGLLGLSLRRILGLLSGLRGLLLLSSLLRRLCGLGLLSRGLRSLRVIGAARRGLGRLGLAWSSIRRLRGGRAAASAVVSVISVVSSTLAASAAPVLRVRGGGRRASRDEHIRKNERKNEYQR